MNSKLFPSLIISCLLGLTSVCLATPLENKVAEGIAAPTPTPVPSAETKSEIEINETTNKVVGQTDDGFLIVEEPGADFAEGSDFEMPFNEVLTGCMYTATYSYPEFCFDDEGTKIFDYTIDGQEVLDRMILRQKGKLGKYNKIHSDSKEWHEAYSKEQIELGNIVVATWWHPVFSVF